MTKIPLQYQRTEFDCGPTAVLNALSHVFGRCELPPDLLKYVMMYTLDCFGERGEVGKNGTSPLAMSFLSGFLNQYSAMKSFPLKSVYLSGAEVNFGAKSPILSALKGGAAVLRVHTECAHYVTLTRANKRSVDLFDPYLLQPFVQKGVRPLNSPSANLRISFDLFEEEGAMYSLGPIGGREAMIITAQRAQK